MSTKTTHTPGPWIYRPDLDRTDSRVTFRVGPDARDVQGPNDIRTDTAICSNSSVLMGVAEAEANARLVAAAPELLGALADMLQQFEEHEQYADGGDEEQHVSDSAVISAARAAIAKATGGDA